jgi:hypothetical protein
MLVDVDDQSGRILNISVCHNIDQPKAFRVWLQRTEYDLRDRGAEPADGTGADGDSAGREE